MLYFPKYMASFSLLCMYQLFHAQVYVSRWERQRYLAKEDSRGREKGEM